MTTPVDVVGSSPISFTNSNGEQKVIPLQAFEFNGSQLGLKTKWQAPLSLSDQTILLALAQALATAGVLTPPPAPPPAPALAFTAKRLGQATNGITVTATTTPGTGGPLTTQITIKATETDTWSGLQDGTAAAKAMGTDPAAAAGFIVVVDKSVNTNAGLPVAVTDGTVQAGKTANILDKASNTVFSIQPRADYAGTAGLSYTVTPDPSGQSFTVTATYDSSKEQGGTTAITQQNLSSLPDPVAYLVSASAPPTGAMVPANNSSVQLSGGAPGIAATGLLYA
jgi:hypothetical protein